MLVFRNMKVLALFLFVTFLGLSKTTGFVARTPTVSQDHQKYEALEERSSLRNGPISSEGRNLQFEGFGIFALISNSVVLVATITGVIISDLAEVVSAVAPSVIEDGISIENIVNIISAQVATTIVTISAEVVSYVTENFNNVLNTFIRTVLGLLDPLDLAVTKRVKVFMEVNKCDYTYSLKSAAMIGTGNINFDTLSIEDFNYEDNVLQFSAEGEISAETLEIKYEGEVSSEDNCLGQTAAFTYSTVYSNIVVSVDAFILGDVMNGNNFTVTTADISTLTVENYLTYASTLSDLPTSFGSDVPTKLTEAMDSYIDKIEEVATTALQDTSTFLDEVGAPLPQSIELPVDIPF